ncbi:uncharacterized protein [Chironomus tepperi]|uniref:uncharacterized protein n=1 Tax=Chironomus tepperi TaxID=113505 RepID=UPI00391F5CA8
MHWTISVGTFLHLLFYAHIIIINFVLCGITQSESDINTDYNHFDSKYFGENETYNNNKRLIIEDFYRQSALSVKSIKDISFHVNTTTKIALPTIDSASASMSSSMTLVNSTSSGDSLSISSSSHGNSSVKMPVEHIGITNSNKNDKSKGMEIPLKRLFNITTMHPFPPPQQHQHNSYNYPSNGTLMTKLMSSSHHGSMPKKTDAPMLNLVYDSHLKQRYPDFRLGTHFDEIAVGSLINVTIQEGKTAYFDCKINLLQDKTVTWVRRIYTPDPNDETRENQELQLLTVGTNTFVADTRYVVDFQHPNNFRLSIRNVSMHYDEGVYECQISTHPPKVIQFYLHVNAPELFIADENLNPLYERHYEVNSTLELYCYVHNIEMTSSVVLWIHNDLVLNYDATRGGISVRTDLTEEGANSTLSVAKINKFDSGNYTCSIGPTHSFTTTVHVLNESFAELFYHGCAVSLIKYQIYTTESLVLLMGFLLSLLSKLLNSLSSNECLSIR